MNTQLIFKQMNHALPQNNQEMMGMALTLMYRALQVMVFYPAGIIAMSVFFLMLINATSTEKVVQNMLEEAQGVLRPAKAGHIIISECIEDAVAKKGSTKSSSKYVCNKYEDREISIAQLAHDATDVITHVYWILVVLSVGCLFFLYGPRRIMGLPYRLERNNLQGNYTQ